MIVTSEKEAELKYKKVNKRPVIYHKELGWVFQPHAIEERSNGYDYHSIQKTNNFGFLDHDRILEKPKDIFRILLLGDSYIEAVQVDIEKKIQSVMEKDLRARGKKVEAIALGFSGMGTSNELLYYRKLGRKFKPDLVILLFISNDFANNSPALHAINEGWHPLKTPRFFYEIDHVKKQIFQIVPVPDYYKYFMPVKNIKKLEEKPWPLDSLLGWSLSYQESKSILKEYVERHKKQVVIDNYFSQRLQFLKKYEFYKKKFEGWNYPNDLDLNKMFYVKGSLPQVFEEAITLTDLSLKLFKEETAKDDAYFFVMAGSFVTDHPSVNLKDTFGREMEPRGMINRLKAITDKYQIPMVELHPIFEKRGSVTDTRWKKDSHWNENGHKWAGEAAVKFILEKGYIK